MKKIVVSIGSEDIVALLIDFILILMTVVTYKINIVFFVILMTLSFFQLLYVFMSIHRKVELNTLLDEKEASLQYAMQKSELSFTDIRQKLLETEVYNTVKNNFPDAYVISNLYVTKSNNQYSEIDVLMLCVDGIFVIECKNYDGKIKGDWSMPYLSFYPHKSTNPFEIQNPVEQNSTHYQHLQRLLSVNIKGSIKNIVVLGNSTYYDKEGAKKRKYGSLIKVYQLVDMIREIRLKSKNIFAQETIDAYYEILNKFANDRDDLKDIHINNIKEMIK